MTRTFLPRALGGAGIVAALVAALTMFAGSGLAQGSAAQANYAPANTAAPAISGTPQVGQVLTATTGTWSSDTTPTYAYAWRQCDAQGNNCAAISAATAATYTVQTADVGKTIRVVVTATNPTGASSATSAQTAVVTQPGPVTPPGPAGAIKLTNGQTSVPATSVGLPERLIVDSVKFTPGRLTSRAAFVGRFHVADTRGYVVRDALVKVTALPYAWARAGGEVRTDQGGWATLTITPTVNMPLGRNALVMFVRARVEGQSLLAGSSSRRLVQITLR
ncbi:MAG: hypothetical protein ACXWYO_04530 [Gaiellaceae bacterium]